MANCESYVVGTWLGGADMGWQEVGGWVTAAKLVEEWQVKGLIR